MSMLEKHQLTGPYFNEWFRTLKLVVLTEKLHDVFETALSPAHAAGADAQALADWVVLFYRHNEVACLMLETIEFQAFVQNYNMQSLEKTISKVRSLLIEFEKSIKRNKQPIVGASSTPQVMAIQGGRVQKYKPQGKAKRKGKWKDTCHYAPSIARGVVSVSHLVDKGFTQYFTDFRLSVSMNNMSYFNAITVNGIYEINMHDSTLPIINSMYSISKKRTKSWSHDGHMWHCHLAHINKKHIEKLQHDGLLKSTNNEPFDHCVSFISGKMIRKFFSHKNEKVKDVLGLIHTDVCGPLRHVSKKGASYFITFTDDYGRYDYVYLLKHKHKVVETFKVSIYGLKQASKSRNKRFDEEIKKFGFHQNLEEPCVYQKASGSNVIFLILYVDDIILMRNHIPSLQEVKTYLGKCFFMKDLGEAAFILGIKIYKVRSRRFIGLSQNAYLNKILKRYRVDNSKRGSIPINIKDTLLVYGGDPEAELRVNCYCDAGFETDREAKYIAASEAAKEAVWIRKFIDEIGDNSAAIIMAKESGIQKGAKQFKRKYHYVCECIETDEIHIVNVHTYDNLDDLCTKALAGPKLTRHARSMGLRLASSFM
nr:retrovirus-related Pol polyprotein from transposon TNT 1-94 [Tanacetum cinerariifolium]